MKTNITVTSKETRTVPERLRLMTASEFRKSPASSEDALRPALLRKQFAAEVKQFDNDERVFEFVITTDSVDREGDRILADGWDFQNYLKNPVMLWAHDYHDMPIARTLSLTLEEGLVKAVVEFAPPEVNPFAEQVRLAYAKGFLRAVSVGFLPFEWSFTEEPDRQFGVDFKRQELLEFSAVPVPANPEALVVTDELLSRSTVYDGEVFSISTLTPESRISGGVTSQASHRRRLRLEGVRS